jgi:dyslexia susceptibility 1 candidate gene 1 protein
MPVKPTFDWEQTDTKVVVRVQVKGFKPDAVDVFISDTFVKINAHPTYLLQLDLLHPIDVSQSGFYRDMPTVKLTLHKSAVQPWDTLCIDPKTPYDEVRARRDGALDRAEKLYNTTLRSREDQKAVEKKRMFHEHWEMEKDLRKEIEGKMKAERETEEKGLAQWEDTIAADAAERAKSIKTPADILAASATVPIRSSGQTTNVTIDFTPASQSMPTRSRGDEDYYLKSRYKPVSIEDAPMFWKEKGDKLYRGRDWQAAANAYSESIKRDGSFLTCVMNRAACHLKVHEYKRCAEDCDLAMTILSNTPASETTQDRYKRILIKIHVRRGAARGWSGEAGRALEDFRMAQAYARTFDEDQAAGEIAEIERDLASIEAYMAKNNLVEDRDPIAEQRSKANYLYMHGNYAGAAEIFTELLTTNEFDFKSRSNLAATFLHMGDFEGCMRETQNVMDFCKDVANALNQPGVQSSNLMDSDDEDEAEDEMVAKRNDAAKTIRERSGHVYVLLKSYVRMAAALCGKQQYKEAYEFMEMAVRISPYDDDLRDDANRILEKLRMDTLVRSTAVGKQNAEDAKAASVAGERPANEL